MNANKLPKAVHAGYVPTLNQQGYMTMTLDHFMRSFVEFAAASSLTALDIGTAYGLAALEVLRAGGTVIANDIDARHLQILFEEATVSERARLTLNTAAFPHTMEFEEGSLGAILSARVLHFLTKEDIMLGCEKMYQWLTPGGKVFITAETPYLGLWRPFIPVYEKRLQRGEVWAGGIEDISLYAPHRADELPKRMLLMDAPTLRYAFESAGFHIEELNTFGRPEFPPDIQLDGRESIGLIARKPALQTSGGQ